MDIGMLRLYGGALIFGSGILLQCSRILKRPSPYVERQLNSVTTALHDAEDDLIRACGWNWGRSFASSKNRFLRFVVLHYIFMSVA